MSNDQSPPARKVIPYKKGGQRKSPFADMAFQFSGTALDVAIQQRQEVVEHTPPEVTAPPAETPSEEEPDSDAPRAPEIIQAQNVSTGPVGPLDRPSAAAERRSSRPTSAASTPQPRQRRVPAREVRLVTDGVNRSAGPGAGDDQLQAFIVRWKPFLTETQLGICAYVYKNSAASGLEYCFTSTAKLMAAVSKTERQVKTVLNQLTDWGFLVKGETVVNAPREQRGTYYKLIVTKA